MLNIRINNDIESFRSDFFKGLSLRECIFGGIGMTAGIAVVASLVLCAHVPIDAATFFGIPVAAPIILCGFVQVNGMHLFEYASRALSVYRSGPLAYHTETEKFHLSPLPRKKGEPFIKESTKTEISGAIGKTEEFLKERMQTEETDEHI
jgi:hypothetical protein